MRRLRRTWSRRPRITLGQTMGVVIGVSLILALYVPAAGSVLHGRFRAFLDVLLLLPSAATLILVLTARQPVQRQALARFLAAGPVLLASIVYFHTMLLGALALQELPTATRGPLAAQPPRTIDRMTYLAVFPVAYFGLVAFLLPRRCPHCGDRALMPWPAPEGSPAAASAEAVRCDECGARCWRSSPGDPWDVDSTPLEAEREWYDTFAPKLRELRRQMRPH